MDNKKCIQFNDRNNLIQDNICRGIKMCIQTYAFPIKRFIKSLNEFERNKATYPDSEKYLEMLKASIATEINNEIQKKTEEQKQRREQLEKKKARIIEMASNDKEQRA